jgi:hypothetical protein
MEPEIGDIRCFEKIAPGAVDVVKTDTGLGFEYQSSL